MFKTFIYIIFLALVSVSCNPIVFFSYYKIYLSAQGVGDLKPGALVYDQSEEVGKVHKIHREELEESVQFTAELLIKNDYTIPINSEIRVITDIEKEEAHIEITPSHGRKTYNKNDTIYSKGAVMLNKDIQLEEVEVPVDSLPEKIQILMR